LAGEDNVGPHGQVVKLNSMIFPKPQPTLV
jgi:hypothetical protein